MGQPQMSARELVDAARTLVADNQGVLACEL
jgi:hypothetical protein